MESNFLQSKWVQSLGKPNRNRARPLIARLTCRADRDFVWKAHYRLKKSRISMGEDLPKHIQEIRKNVLIPAMKTIKQETASHKAVVVGDKLVVNGKVYFRYGSLSTLRWIPRWIMAMVQPNNKNHCKVKKNPLMLWSNPKNCKLYFCLCKYEDFRHWNGTLYFHASLTGNQI